ALGERPRLDTCGFRLVEHRSRVDDFYSERQVAGRYAKEMRTLLQAVTHADAVVITSPGLIRFGERSQLFDSRDNSRPARFVHIDVSDRTAADFAEGTAPVPMERVGRWAHYNLWRVITQPPQDVPLTVCDARTVGPSDLVPADAVFDVTDRPEWTFEALVVRYGTQQRWYWFSDMQPGEVLIFRTNDSLPEHRPAVPHSAFDNPAAGDPPPRVSIEARGICYWYR
ncbi:MAG: CmcJ/NvfI family oxidoreductase, partial [Gammaproteobacteria bacterium]